MSLRVLIETDTVGGVWSFSLDLADALRHQGDEVLLAAFGPEDSRTRLREANERGVPAVFRPAVLEWQPGVTHDDLRPVGNWLRGEAARWSADVVQLCSYAHAAIDSWPCPIVLTAHSDIATWWQAVKGERPPAQYADYRRRVAAGLCRADAVVAPTRAFANMLAETYGGVDTEWFRIIPNGRSPIKLPSPAHRSGVLAVGRFWDEAKNLQVLTTAAERLGDRVRVIGDGGETVLRRALHLGKRDTNGVRALMANSAVFAGCAIYEPFGLAALEAAMAGCCLVLSDLPTYREVWGDAACFVDPRRPDQWAVAIQRLLTDRPARQHLALAAGARAHRYSAGVMTDAYRSLYQSLGAGTELAGHASRSSPAALVSQEVQA